MADKDLAEILKSEPGVEYENQLLQLVPQGDIIPDGFVVKTGGESSYRWHLALQHTNPDSSIVRFRIAVPKKTIADPRTWTVYKLRYKEQQ